MRHALIPGLTVVAALAGCGHEVRRGETVLFASGADLQSINPLLTVHPLARQVQRYMLLTTLIRYDTSLVPRPYLAREWRWSPDRRELVLELYAGLDWHDGVPTTARDVVWTLGAARDPAVGYPRLGDLAGLVEVAAHDSLTVRLRFADPQPGVPDVLTDLAILPEHRFRGVDRARLRQSPWNREPVGNGPFRFVRHESNRRWVFAANAAFPEILGGPPQIDRLVLAVVDEPTTKLAALVSGELDFAGIQPAHAAFVRREPDLTVLDYPLLFTYGLVLNTRRPPFDRVEVRWAISAAIDRDEIVAAHVYGFGTPAFGPMVGGGSPVPRGVRPATAVRAEFEILTAGSGEGTLEQLVQAQLARAGFTARIRQLELSTFLGRLYGPARDFDAAILGIPGDLGLGYLRPLAELAGASPGRGPEETAQVLADSTPVVFLYHARGVQGMNRRVRGVRMDLRGELATVQEWRIER